MPSPKIHKRSWSALTPRQKVLRKKSLQVLRETRKSKDSLSKIAKKNEISPSTVIHNTDAFKKKGNRWIPERSDWIPRMMIINEKLLAYAENYIERVIGFHSTRRRNY